MDQAMLLVDEAAQSIATGLIAQSEIASAKYRKAFGLGPITVTGFAQPRRFDAVMTSLHGRLLQNRALSNVFRMVNVDKPTADAVITAVGGASVNDRVAADATAAAGAAVIDPDDIYILAGRFMQAGDLADRRKTLLLSIEISKPATRQVAFQKEFVRRFEWDALAAVWRPVD